MSNTIKFDQKVHYQVVAKYIQQKKPTLQRDIVNNDAKALGGSLSRTFASPQNSTALSSPINQFSHGSQTPQKSLYQVKSSYNNVSVDNNTNIRNLKNNSLQSIQQNNVNKLMHHRRLKQTEDISKNHSQISLAQSHSSQHQNGKDLNDKLFSIVRNQSSTPFSKQNKSVTQSGKTIHNFDFKQDQKLLYSTLAQSQVKNMSLVQPNIFTRKSLKHLYENVVNLESAKASMRSLNTELISNQLLDSYENLNEKFQQKYDWIDRIESKQFQNVTTFNPDQYFKTAASKKIRKQSINIIDSKSIDSQQIQDGAINILRCEINEFIYFKIKILERKSPLRIKFQIENNQANFKLYVSKTCFQPNNFNCDDIYNNAKVISIEEEKNQSVFRKHPYLYCALVSEQDLEIQIKYTFGYEERRDSKSMNSNQKKAPATQVTEESISQMKFSKLKQNVQEIQQEKLQKMNDVESFIQKNIQVTSEIDQFTKNLAIYQKKRQSSNHLNYVIKKAAELQEAKQHAIEEEQQSKLIKQFEKIRRFRYDFFAFFWIQIVSNIKKEQYNRYISFIFFIKLLKRFN